MLWCWCCGVGAVILVLGSVLGGQMAA